jgi:RimJ/RimL family protein N-acetyltransferase
VTRPPKIIAPPARWRKPTPLPLPIETRRLLIRAQRTEDAHACFKVVDRHREALSEWLAWPRSDHTDEARSRATLARFEAEAHNPDGRCVMMFIFERDTGALLGGIGLNDFDHAAHATTLGYWVSPERRGEGLCTEACAAVISSAFTPQARGGWGLRRISLTCDERNTASRRIPEKLGMRLEARRREDVWADRGDGWRTTLEFATLSREWDHANARAKPGTAWAGEPFRQNPPA